MNDRNNLADFTTPRPMRSDIDLVMYARIQREPEDQQALIRSLLQQAHDAQDDIQHAQLFFPASTAARAHWREGDDTSVFLQMPEGQAAQFPAEVRAARRIQQDKDALAALRARIQTLHERHQAALQLARACERFAQNLEG